LESPELRRVWRGYDALQVHELLRSAAHQIAAKDYEIRMLKSEIDRLEPLRNQAALLSNALLSAQQMAGEKIAQANREAEKILSEAHSESARIVAEAHEAAEETEDELRAKFNDLRWQIERTAIEKDRVVTTYRSFLTEQLESVSNSSRRYATLAIIERASLESEAVADVREVEFEPGSQWTDDVQDFDMAVEA